MRIVFLWVFGLVLAGGAAEDENKLRGLLEAAATNRCTAYLENRAAILALGTNALPALARCVVNRDLTWQQRLVARICYERLGRGADIEVLRAYNWSADPGYRKEWENCIVGPGLKMSTIVVPKCRETGLWYYYVELTWKETEEGIGSRYRDVQGRWPHWCLDAVAREPERYWYRYVVSERMLASPFSAWHLGRYQTFLREKDAEMVPLLVKCYDAYKASVSGIEMYPGARVEGYRNSFISILTFADSRHAELLENFISEKPALEPLKKRLAEVRARPAPPPQSEPPFRLGTNAVVIAP